MPTALDNKIIAKTLRAAVYARLSTEEQNRQDLSMPKVQIPKAMDYIREAGWRFIKTYTDVADCNKFDKRAGLQEMLSEVKDFDIIVVYEFARLWGDSDYTKGRIFNILDKNRIQVTAVLQKTAIVTPEDYDPKCMNVKNQRLISGIGVAYDRGRRRENFMASRLATINNGKCVTSPIYGYDIKREIHPTDNKRTIGYRIINEYEASVLKRILNERTNGGSLRKITAGLNKDGIKTKKGKEWTCTNLSRLIKNPLCCGYFYWNKTQDRKMDDERICLRIPKERWKLITISKERERYYKPIVTKEVWEKAQQVGKIYSNLKGRAGHSRNILAGLLYCAHCGGGMNETSFSWRGGKLKPLHLTSYYVCREWLQKNKCDKKGHNAQRTKEQVISEVERYLNCPEAFEIALASQKNEKIGEKKKEIRGWETKLRQTETRLYNLNLDWIDRKIKEGYYHELLQNLEDEQIKTRGHLIELKDGLKELEEKREQVYKVQSLAEEIKEGINQLDIPQQKILMQMLIEKVIIIDGVPKVSFKI